MKCSILWVAFVCATINPLFAQKWNQLQKISTTGQERRLINECGRNDNDQFGNEVEIDSNRMAVGAFYRDDDTGRLNNINSGAVYLYKRESGKWKQYDKIYAPDRFAATGDNFGHVISMKGDWMFVGAPKNDKDTANTNFVNESGAVYVFKYQQSKWKFHQKLVAPDRDINDFFGQKIDVGLHFAVIGVYYEDDDSSENNPISFSGSAYVYRINNGYWVLDKKLTSKNRIQNENFGYSVCVSDSIIAIGATGTRTNASNTNSLTSAGAVFVYKNFGGSWIQIQKIVPSDRAINDQFGFSIAFNGNTLVVGSQKNNAGRIYFFERSGNLFSETQKLSSKDIALGDKFGIDLKLKGNLCVVGASEEQEDTNGLNARYLCGSAYVFNFNNGVWTQIKKLVSNQRLSTSYFGTAVAISDSNVVVTSPGSSANSKGFDWVKGEGAGAVHSFELDTNIQWVHSQKIVISDYTIIDNFGNSVSVRDSIAIIGAPNEDSDADNLNEKYNSGAAYIYKKHLGKWRFLQKITPKDRRSYDNFGYTVSAGDGFVFVSSPYSQLDSAGQDSIPRSGSVYVFKDSSGTYVEMKKITAFDRSKDNQLGFSLDNRGNNLVVGSISNSKDSAGLPSTMYVGAVYFYQLDSGKWKLKQKIKPSDGQVNDYFGCTVSMEGDYLAVGAMYHSLDSAGNNMISMAGATYVYKKVNGRYLLFQKITPDLRGAAYFGNSVSLSGPFLVVGAKSDSRVGSYTSTGSAYIYKLSNNHFYQVQRLNSDFKQNYSLFGNSVALDKRSLYVTCYPETYKNGTDSFLMGGYVYAYRKTAADTWSRYDKFTSKDVSSLDWFGYSVSADSGSVLVGAINEDQDANGKLTLSDAGAAYFFEPEKCTIGSQISVFACDSLISPSGNSIWRKSGNYSDTFYRPGHCDSIVKVNLKIGKSTQTFNIGSCTYFKSPSGKYIWDTSGTYRDTLNSYSGCDSIFVYNLNVVKAIRDTFKINSCQAIVSSSGKYIYNVSGIYSDTLNSISNCDSIITVQYEKYESYSVPINVKACNYYNSPSGRYQWNTSGVYLDTLSTINGCDSILNIALQIHSSISTSINLSSCEPMVSPSGRYIWSNSGNFSDTLLTTNGCDSIIQVQFVKLNSTFSSLTASSCNEWQSPSGRRFYQSGVYQDTLINAAGCDSIIQIKLTILKASISQLQLESCDSLTSPSGKFVMSTTDVYYDTLVNSSGCDSIVTINFFRNNSASTQQNISVCKSYFHALSGKTYNQSTVIRDTLQTIHGCDSLVVTNLTVSLPAFNIFESNDTLFSDIELGSVRWSYCDSNFVPVLSTGYNFKPNKNGFYQAELSLNGCKDTTDCIQYTKSSLTNIYQQNYTVYPNPFGNEFVIESGELYFEFKVYDVSGKLILNGHAEKTITIDMSDCNSGIYLIEMKSLHSLSYIKLIKQ